MSSHLCRLPWRACKGVARGVLLGELEKLVDVVHRLPPSLPESKTTHIFGGMVQIQIVKDATVKSFGDLARTHFDSLTSLLDASCNMIDVVFEYKDVRIKGGGRNRRGAHSVMEITIRSHHTPVPKQ
jgi:hypothetical protein